MDVISFESSQPIVSELRQQLPRMAEMLGVCVDDIAVVDYNFFPKEYMTSPLRDKVIATSGVLKGLPHIQRTRLQGPSRVGLGIYLYENSLEPKLKYILYCVRGGYQDETYLVVPKGSLFRLKRAATALNKLANQTLHAPVLEDGLLEHVVRNTVGFLLQAKKIERYGVKIKRGVLLMGEPGNGKTMLCRYIQKLCSQNGIEWGVITSADIDQAYADKELNWLFTRFTVSFFDDIDIQYMDRTKGNGKMACSLLTAMDGMYDSGHLVRIFTTNEQIKDLDSAFTRPGRIDQILTLNKPTTEMRRRLVATWPEEIQNNIDIDKCLQSSDNFSFAELEAIRTFLVTNRILGDGTWNLTAAFDEYHARRDENEKRGVGFLQSSPLEGSFNKRSRGIGLPCQSPALAPAPAPAEEWNKH